MPRGVLRCPGRRDKIVPSVARKSRIQQLTTRKFCPFSSYVAQPPAHVGDQTARLDNDPSTLG